MGAEERVAVLLPQIVGYVYLSICLLLSVCICELSAFLHGWVSTNPEIIPHPSTQHLITPPPLPSPLPSSPPRCESVPGTFLRNIPPPREGSPQWRTGSVLALPGSAERGCDGWEHAPCLLLWLSWRYLTYMLFNDNVYVNYLLFTFAHSFLFPLSSLIADYPYLLCSLLRRLLFLLLLALSFFSIS